MSPRRVRHRVGGHRVDPSGVGEPTVGANAANGGDLPARDALVRGAEGGDQHPKARLERLRMESHSSAVGAS